MSKDGAVRMPLGPVMVDVAGLALDDAIRLAEAVFEANADFFIRRVVPEITRVSQTLGTLIPGQTPLPGSSDPATATPTS